MSGEILGVWVAAFLTLCIVSYLYKDNPFYKFAEHLFVGVGAAYWASSYFWNQVQPNLLGRLWPRIDSQEAPSVFLSIWYVIYAAFGKILPTVFPSGGIDAGHSLNLWYLVPLVLGLFMLLRLWPKAAWLGRWSLAFAVGLAAGLKMYSFLHSNIIRQIEQTVLPIASAGSWSTAVNNFLLIAGVLSGLAYFYFAREHKGVLGGFARVGIYFLMISFGASFGFAVMSRVSLLIGRIDALLDYGTANSGYATPIILAMMSLALVLLRRSDRPDRSEPETEPEESP